MIPANPRRLDQFAEARAGTFETAIVEGRTGRKRGLWMSYIFPQTADGRSADAIMGYPDNLKIQSSMTLFAEVSSPGLVFERVLQKYYGEAKDPKTIEFLERDLRATS